MVKIKHNRILFYGKAMLYAISITPYTSKIFYNIYKYDIIISK
jgi:hypothetical protein